MQQPHSCNLSGHCEPNPLGLFLSSSLCQTHCTPTSLNHHEREMMFLSISYDPEQAFSLAPSDQVLYLQREFGIASTPAAANYMLLALYSNNYLSLYRLGQLDYLTGKLPKAQPARSLDDLDFCLLKLLEKERRIRVVNWEALRFETGITIGFVMGQVKAERFRAEPEVWLREIYDLINQLVKSTTGVELQALGEDEVAPETLWEIVEWMIERYLLE